MAAAVWTAWLTRSLARVRERDLLRVLRPILPVEGPGASPVKVLVTPATHSAWMEAGEAAAAPGGGSAFAGLDEGPAGNGPLHDLTLFSTNDYLGLSTHARVKDAVCSAVARHGMGPRASSLVAGHTHEQRNLELQLARLKGHEDAVLFPCGFSANVAVAAVLAADDDVAAFSDELNHASIIDGLRLATRATKGVGAKGPRTSIYRHNDMGHLEQLLAATQAARKVVITDSLFSMDGDFAPIRELLALRDKHGFLLVLDDAHATLVCDGHAQSSLQRSAHGRAGTLAAEAADMSQLCKRADVVVGTMSKAMGSQGGFVCCSSDMRSMLINYARPLIYSTALPVPVVAASSSAIRTSQGGVYLTWYGEGLGQEDASIRDQLWRRVAQFEELTGIPAQSPIVPVILGPEAAALDASRQLLARGMHVPAIRPPTVQPGTSRLRVALSAAHSEADVEALAGALADAGVLSLAARFSQQASHSP